MIYLRSRKACYQVASPEPCRLDLEPTSPNRAAACIC